MIKKSFERLLLDLLSLPTAPFHETAVRETVLRELDHAGIVRRIDRAGNVIARLRRGPPRPPLAFVAHMDHPGFQLERVDSRGMGVGRVLGGVGEPMIGHRILFFTDPPAPARIIRIVERDRSGRPERVRLKIHGAVPAGTFGRWAVPGPYRRGSRLFAPGIDDVCAVGILLEVLRRCLRSRAPMNLYCCFTRAEEVGFIGAAALAKSRVLPARTRVLSLEMSKALPGRAEQGKGFVIRVGDRATMFDPGFTDFMIWLAARARKMPYQIARLDGGACEATLFNVLGYRASGVALPLGNYHNRTPSGGVGAEYIDLRDLAGLTNFLTELAGRTGDLGRPRDELRKRLGRNYIKWRRFL
ncbi:hypothetical protein HY522_00205 [bacterium]|nr:hypothetical protein [bacterium]